MLQILEFKLNLTIVMLQMVFMEILGLLCGSFGHYKF
jgi:hypothetical protein